jgi:hypothetical protein
VKTPRESPEAAYQRVSEEAAAAKAEYDACRTEVERVRARAEMAWRAWCVLEARKETARLALPATTLRRSHPEEKKA